MISVRLAVLAALLAPTACAAQGEPADRIHGSVSYRERRALTPEAVIEVRLLDVSRQDAPAPVVAETTFSAAGSQVPISFALRYDPRGIEDTHTYAVRATIRDAGRMVFTTDPAYHVITQGNPTRADLSLVAIGEDVGEAGPAPSSAFQVPPSRSGILTAAGGALRFVGCGEEGEGLAVQDLPTGEGQALVRELGGGGRVIVLVRLEGDRLTDIRYAGGEGPGCDRLPPDGDIEVRGTEPFWHLQLTGSTATTTTPEAPAGDEFQNGRWTATGGPWRYQAERREDGSVVTLAVELVEERCRDSMSGAAYPFTAAVRIDSLELHGCALEGRNAFASAGAGVLALDGTQWRLEDLAGTGVIDDAQATLGFTERGKVAGRGSCNRFFANVEISGDSIRFGPIAATRMACGKATMRQEGRYFKALEAAERFSLDDATLLIYSRGLDRPLRFVKQDS